MQTRVTRASDVERKHYVIDADGLVLGRLASRVAQLLRGKGKVNFAPNLDMGDFVIVVNAEKIRLTGNKMDQKVYFRHSGYPGGAKFKTVKRLMEENPEEVVRKAVRGMLPKSRLGRKMLRKLRVYSGPDHPHQAQKPETLSV
ncbi:MAG: 50S ribosomal protein L13 [Candidatus Eisenbacteria bacterium]|nr:50S ribosomal protein L13 [Candidatus Eisenbacteria bacterium]